LAAAAAVRRRSRPKSPGPLARPFSATVALDAVTPEAKRRRFIGNLTAPFGEVLEGLQSCGAKFQDIWFRDAPDEWLPATLRGNWAPVREETEGLAVEILYGMLPTDLPHGRFVRNGPNPRWVRPGMSGYHPFEGDGMLHAVELGAPHGVAKYSNRWVRTAKWLAENAAQVPLMSGLVDDNPLRLIWNIALNLASVCAATLPIALNFTALWAVGGTFVTNTSVVSHAGTTMALGECGKPITVDVCDLRTTGCMDTGGSFNAHPKVCPLTGELIWCGYRPDSLDYGVWDSQGKQVHRTNVSLPHCVMVHDMAITRSYTIFLDCPLRLDLDGAMTGDSPVIFDKDSPMRLGLLPRFGGGDEVTWFEVPGPGKMVFHVMNAFEDEATGEVVVIGCAAAELDLLKVQDIPFQAVRLTEWRVDPVSGHVAERVLTEEPCEFPRIDDRRTGLPFRFGYAAAFASAETMAAQGGHGPLFRGFLKYDRTLGEATVCEMGDRRFCGEPVFAPRCNSTAEDDGYVLVHVHDEDGMRSEVHIYDARTPEEGPVCCLGLPRRVPYGFHATWIVEDS